MQKLAEICVRRPVFATMLVLSLVVVGTFSFFSLGLDLFPKIDFPTITVTVVNPGASPEEVETEITEKIEEAVNTISGIDELRSSSVEGVSQVFVQFVLEKDVNIAAQEVENRVQTVIPNLPGYPDNINRASDGNYWLALVGMRTPSLDLALKMPGFRRRMARRVAPDEWLFPNINSGGVAKFTEDGSVVDVLGDLGGSSHPMVTSMREHRGSLFIGGILNNRIGRLKLADADPDWTGWRSYWAG